MTKLSPSMVFVFLLLTAVPLYVHGLSAVDLTEKQLIDKAEMIVIGKVLSAYSEKDSSRGDIFTYISVRITDQLKGKSRSKNIILKTAGGQVGEEIVYYPGAADFYRNEEVLLFLERGPDGNLMPIGMMLGKYSVYRDSQTGKSIVLRHTDGNGQYFASPRPDTVLIESGKKLYLHDFRDRIRKIAGYGR